MLRCGIESETVQVWVVGGRDRLPETGLSIVGVVPVSCATSCGGLNGRWNIMHAFASMMGTLAESFQDD
ncbi:hypothetical protein RESH_03784 [Rhodopirellula europaea SH398]|uniref:Uncharacterized protein n=1 Tax=Rhodopirellula europaea SH398 TaxID=1263868 RepID=M5S282_9BACT|nr:hypothetical protein RESH_03784 [Rhodopirellula europaea SH398]